jgi:hypothetical protein
MKNTTLVNLKKKNKANLLKKAVIEATLVKLLEYKLYSTPSLLKRLLKTNLNETAVAKTR